MHWCFCCYGLNVRSSGPCEHCGGEISAPEDLSFEERLIWTLGHPDGDRALLAARALGQQRVVAAVPRLRDVATSHRDPFLAAEALKSLLEIEGADELRPVLHELVSAGPFLVAKIAADALNR